jgi:hypothetical protein
MKKILLAIIFLSVVVFVTPFSVFGADIELTVTITGVQIPKRAAIADLPLDTEYEISTITNYYNKLLVVRNRDSFIMNRENFMFPGCYGICASLEENAYRTVSFTYNSEETYSVYVEIPVVTRGTNTICKSDCTPISSGEGWYRTRAQLVFDGEYRYCPISVCSDYRTYIAFGPEIAPQNIMATTGYWRSPAIFTID